VQRRGLSRYDLGRQLFSIVFLEATVLLGRHDDVPRFALTACQYGLARSRTLNVLGTLQEIEISGILVFLRNWGRERAWVMPFAEWSDRKLPVYRATIGEAQRGKLDYCKFVKEPPARSPYKG